MTGVIAHREPLQTVATGLAAVDRISADNATTTRSSFTAFSAIGQPL